jgi:hypothetical protein
VDANVDALTEFSPANAESTEYSKEIPDVPESFFLRLVGLFGLLIDVELVILIVGVLGSDVPREWLLPLKLGLLFFVPGLRASSSIALARTYNFLSVALVWILVEVLSFANARSSV